jgi:large subunit ribosomal protein L4
MPVVAVYNLERQQVGTIDLSDSIFGTEVKEHLFHEVVRSQLAAARQGTHATKERSDVSGSVKKIYKQKGTGRARHGNRKAGIFVGGGTTFGPHPREYILKVNKKVRHAALCSALSRRAAEQQIVVIDDMTLPQVKTKQVSTLMKRFEVSKVLIVDVTNENLSLSTRNIPNAQYLAVAGLNVYDVLKHDTVLLSKAAAQALHERMA